MTQRRFALATAPRRFGVVATIIALGGSLLSAPPASASPSPAILAQAELTLADGGQFDQLGLSVAAVGDTVVVGVPGRTVGANPSQGAVLVYTEPASGFWADASTPAAVLTAPNGTEGDELGISVAISGDTIVAGASNVNNQTGAAYVFTKPATGGWAAAAAPAELTPTDGAGGDTFGKAVAVSDDTIVVGAPKHAVGANSAQGSVYVFTEPTNGGWANSSTAAELTASDGAASDTFGASVAVVGPTVVVGSPQHTVGSTTWQGTVYVFTSPSAGGWVSTSTPTGELTTADPGDFDQLGASVAADGDTIVAGAPGHTTQSGFEGAVDVFTEPTAGGWVDSAAPVAELTAPDSASSDQLGTGVAISGATIVAGAPQHTIGSGLQQGEGYVYAEPAGGGWVSTNTAAHELISSDGGTSDTMGTSVAIADKTFVAGAPAHPTSSGGNGTVYLFTPQAPAPTSTLGLSGAQRVGSTAAPAALNWSPAGGVTSYQWRRSGVSIKGATGRTHLVAIADIGHRLSVTESYQVAGAPATVVTASSPTAVVAGPGPKVSSRVSIAGRKTVASTAKITAGAFTGPRGVTLRVTRQWYRSGQAIAGATGASYRFRLTDIGKVITARETATPPAPYAAVTSTSNPIRVFRVATTERLRLTGARSHTARLGLTVTVVGQVGLRGTYAPSGRVRVYSDGNQVAAATLATSKHGTVRVRLPALAIGRHTVKVTYAGNATSAPSWRRLIVRIAR